MKTIQEQIAVMQHFAAGGKIEMQRTDGSWKLNDEPQWEWSCVDYRIAEEIDRRAKPRSVSGVGLSALLCVNINLQRQ